MSRFAQYYIKFRHDIGPYEWEQRQQHLAGLLQTNDSIEFSLGEGSNRKVYKHRVYHLNINRNVTVMRFANDIDIPVERDFEESTTKDEPSCFVIIDNRANLRTVAIQKRKRAFSNTRMVAQILTSVIGKRLFDDHCYGFEILPDYYPVDLFTVWQQKQAYTQALRFSIPNLDKDEILQQVADLKTKQPEHFDDGLMNSMLDFLIAQKQAKYKSRYIVMPEDKKTALFLDKDSTYMRNLLTFAQAVGEPVELVTSDGGVFRCFIDNDEDTSDKIVSHEFNDHYLEALFTNLKKDGSKVEPEDLLKAEQEIIEFMNSMKHEASDEEENQAA